MFIQKCLLKPVCILIISEVELSTLLATYLELKCQRNVKWLLGSLGLHSFASLPSETWVLDNVIHETKHLHLDDAILQQNLQMLTQSNEELNLKTIRRKIKS
jgi:hypothetical protein